MPNPIYSDLVDFEHLRRFKELLESQFSDEIAAALASAIEYKGVKPTVADLPASGNKVGDMWHVAEDGGEYAWDGSQWQEMGSVVDLSPYVKHSDVSIVTNAQIDAMFSV